MIPTDLRERLGRVGVWLASLRPASIEQERAAARRIEALGYGSLWAGEVLGGKEAFSHQGVLLTATERIVTGTGIANLWARHPATMQAGAATLGAAYPGRFILGIGVSHASIVERSGQTYERPLTRMAEYLDGMELVAGEVPVTLVPVPRVLAALGPKMLALARDRADGAHPYFVPVEHTPAARRIIGPDRLLIPEQAVVLSTDAEQARRIARGHTTTYLRLPNYVNNLRRLGYGDEDLAAAGSDRLVDAIVAWGDEEQIAGRVKEHLEGGADHVLLQPLGDLESAVAQLERLAPAVLGT
ncbi:MAG: LLM class F420-dependent oxidoreductase [Candidatus Dormiibacterota bacterium]